MEQYEKPHGKDVRCAMNLLYITLQMLYACQVGVRSL